MGMYTELVFKGFLKDNLPNEVIEVLHYLFGDPDEPKRWAGWHTIKYDRDKIKEELGKDCFTNEEINEYFWKPEIDHKFFECPWWRDIANSSSHYHIPQSFKTLENDRYIFTRCDLKNYHREIEEFLDWIKPYLDMEQGSCIGWYWYQEESEPTLIYI